jgi:hypothetical protein
MDRPTRDGAALVGYPRDRLTAWLGSAYRAIWQLGEVQVQDGGEDGEGATTTDNTLFLKQGIFVP